MIHAPKDRGRPSAVVEEARNVIRQKFRKNEQFALRIQMKKDVLWMTDVVYILNGVSGVLVLNLVAVALKHALVLRLIGIRLHAQAQAIRKHAIRKHVL
ncbi:MAG: hypothetical protein A2728_00250 [Candidatus Spechtbacteria bacterium RIFCSPHIGHO2_01_FULL_38_11]|nr:MAG: hypothetical protein A2728_00250 [Candidatus Spechtbacteria bacterium RIFCSPHIGHO2_01_FULL_38_11]